MRHCAKFRADRSNRCGDMAIFRFLYGSRPPSWICFTRTTYEEYLVVFVTVQNSVGIGEVVSIKCLFTPLLSGFGGCDP